MGKSYPADRVASTQNPIDVILGRLERGGCDPRPCGTGKWESKCPAHQGSRRNLSIAVGSDGAVLLRCHHVDESGQNCQAAEIVAALGLGLRDLFKPVPGSRRVAIGTSKRKGAGFDSPRDAAAELARMLKAEPTAHWVYRDIEGTAYAAVYRFDLPDGKTYRPVHVDPATGHWKIGDPTGWLPYRLPEMIAANGRVWFLEGEKCADLARSLGLTSTTTAHGAQSPRKTDLSALAGRDVVILPDAGAPGEGYAAALLDLLGKLDPPPRTRVLRLPGLADGEDLEQWLAGRDGADPAVLAAELARMADELPDVSVVGPPSSVNGNGHTVSPAFIAAQEDPINRTDMGNAQRLVKRFGADLRYCTTLKSWLVWNGVRWREDATGEVYRLAKKTVRMIGVEASEADSDDEAKALLKWALTSESKKQIDAMVGLAWNEPGIPVENCDLDRDPWLLNVENGTIDLKTGELRPHRKEDLITRLAPVRFDPKADCPRWHKVLHRIFKGDDDLIRFVQRAAGYALTGDVGEHCLFFLYGTGRNGKGTFIETLLALMGDYATALVARRLTVNRTDDHPTEIADLAGRRLVSTSEVDKGRQLAEAFVKYITGGDLIKARRLYRDEITFKPTHKLFLAANHKPEIKGTDEGIWSRIMLVPFTVFIPPPERVRNLSEILVTEEGPGILAWAVNGCLSWQADGLKPPEKVRAATKSYRDSQDVLGGFFEEHCILDPDHPNDVKVKSGAIYARYTAWCADAKETPLSLRAFGETITERGIQKSDRTKTGIYYLGIGLRPNDVDGID